MENSHQRHDEMIADYCDGQVYRQHPLFSRDPHALHKGCNEIFLFHYTVTSHETFMHVPQRVRKGI